MGQQVYEEAIACGAAPVLGSDWRVQKTVVRSLRSPLDGTIRLPARLFGPASPALRRSAGRAIYRGSDVVHRMDLRLPPAPFPEVLTIHDVVSWRFPDEGTPPRAVAQETRAAAVVICPSAFSATEIHETLGVAEPVVIHNGVHPRFFGAQPASESVLAALGIHLPYVLHAGGCSLRKNLAGLAAAWPRVRDSHPQAMLVLAGPGDARRNRLFEPLGGAVLLGRLPSELLTPVLAAASVIVVPSIYEGFGIPALEGMAAGVAVVAAARSSLPEVCGNAAILVEPSGEGLAAGLVHALDAGSDISDLISRGRRRSAMFTWDESVRSHAAIWRSVA